MQINYSEENALRNSANINYCIHHCMCITTEIS